MYNLSQIIPPNQRITQIPDNHHQHQEKRRTAVTIRLKRENRPYHLGGNQKEEQLFSDLCMNVWEIFI